MTRLLLLLCLAFVAIPRGAHAEDPATRTAKRHFDRGEKLFALGRFDEALDEYQKAYDAKPLPDFLFNIGQCYRNLGDFDRAIFSYKKYLEAGDPDADDRAKVDKLIADLEKKRERGEGKRIVKRDDPLVVETPDHPIYKRWWFVTGLAVVAVGAGAGIYFATRSSAPATDLGTDVFSR